MVTALITASAAGLFVVLVVARYARARANRRYEAVLRRLDEQLEPISKRLQDAVERTVGHETGVADRSPAPEIKQLLEEIAAEGAAVQAFRRVAKEVVSGESEPGGDMGRYETELARKIAGARRTGRPLSLVLVDLDPPAPPEADLVLQELATMLEHVTRASDSVCRRRPDELGILLPETTEEGARRFHRRVRAELARTSFGRAAPPTFSVGIVEWQPNETGAALDARAHAVVRRTTAGPLEAVD